MAEKSNQLKFESVTNYQLLAKNSRENPALRVAFLGKRPAKKSVEPNPALRACSLIYLGALQWTR
jgi:hypothetical protein